MIELVTVTQKLQKKILFCFFESVKVLENLKTIVSLLKITALHTVFAPAVLAAVKILVS